MASASVQPGAFDASERDVLERIAFDDHYVGQLPEFQCPDVAVHAQAPRAVERSAAQRLVRERPIGLETAHIAAERRTSDEGQDGLRAFLERRAAGWLDAD